MLIDTHCHLNSDDYLNVEQIVNNMNGIMIVSGCSDETNKEVLELIEKYRGGTYLFPILSAYHKTEVQIADRLHKVLGKVNKYLKQIGKELKLPIPLTTYVARHSYATVLKRSGVSTSIISESLGHSTERITQVYLDSFGNDQMDEAMKNLL